MTLTLFIVPLLKNEVGTVLRSVLYFDVLRLFTNNSLTGISVIIYTLEFLRNLYVTFMFSIHRNIILYMYIHHDIV